MDICCWFLVETFKVRTEQSVPVVRLSLEPMLCLRMTLKHLFEITSHLTTVEQNLNLAGATQRCNHTACHNEVGNARRFAMMKKEFQQRHTFVERRLLERAERRRARVVLERLHVERREDRAALKDVGVVAHLATWGAQ